MSARDDALKAAKLKGSLDAWNKAWKMKPEGLTDVEWEIYQNCDPQKIDPRIRLKVENILGLRQDDVAAAREIAEQVLGAVTIADSIEEVRQANKGHVPEENMHRYRRLKELSHLISRMGNMVSGLGEHGDANVLWAMGGKYKRLANELRADLPDKPREEEQ